MNATSRPEERPATDTGSVHIADGELRRRGSRLVGRCPFHPARTRTLAIDVGGVFACFGCDARGRAIHEERGWILSREQAAVR